MPQLTGTLIKPDLTPVSGFINIQLKENTSYLTSVAVKTVLSYPLDSNGGFLAILVPGTYEVTLPNLTKVQITLESSNLNIKDFI
jgi:hypothetical protein